jgi:hypothetical protein
MKSTPGSERATPLHGHVKFVPSIRNWFSLTLEPNAETLVVDTLVVVAVAGDVGEMPGAERMKSNILNRPVGIVRRYSGPTRVSNPLLRASMREPAPCTVMDSATPATLNTAVRSIVAPPPIRMSSS